MNQDLGKLLGLGMLAAASDEDAELLALIARWQSLQDEHLVYVDDDHTDQITDKLTAGLRSGSARQSRGLLWGFLRRRNF